MPCQVRCRSPTYSLQVHDRYGWYPTGSRWCRRLRRSATVEDIVNFGCSLGNAPPLSLPGRVGPAKPITYEVTSYRIAVSLFRLRSSIEQMLQE